MSRVTVPALAAWVGQVLDDRYRLEALLGHGGMGAVYRGHQLAMDRRVAIKVLQPHWVGHDTAARRFAREARGTFRVASDHAVKVYDFAMTTDGTPYMVMEYLDGRTVRAELDIDGVFAPHRAVRVMRQACAALAAAHDVGLVHRDLKPENIMLVARDGDPDFVKVLDFGLAKLIDGVGPGVFSKGALSQDDMVFGTPHYLSPEHALGQPVNGRSDLYSLGATLFEMLTGQTPFSDASAMVLLTRHVQAPPPHLAEILPSLAMVPGYVALDELVQSCLAKDPAHRPPSAAALSTACTALESELAAAAARVPSAVAAAKTLDLGPAGGAAADGGPAGHRTPRAAVAATGAHTTPMSTSTISTSPVIARRGSRRWWIAAGGAAVAGVAMLLLRVSSPRDVPAPAPPVAPTQTAVPPQTGAPPARSTSEARPPDHAPTPAPSPEPDQTRATDTAPPRRPAAASRSTSIIARHLDEAASARAAGNRLRQLAEADAALRIDPGNLRARFLLGDALVGSGDIRNGCKYLRSARRLPAAQAALAAASCPAD